MASGRRSSTRERKPAKAFAGVLAGVFADYALGGRPTSFAMPEVSVVSTAPLPEPNMESDSFHVAKRDAPTPSAGPTLSEPFSTCKSEPEGGSSTSDLTVSPQSVSDSRRAAPELVSCVQMRFVRPNRVGRSCHGNWLWCPQPGPIATIATPSKSRPKPEWLA